MNDNIVHAQFNGRRNAVTTRSIYQWDYGMRLVFSGLDLPTAYTVHFANNAVGGSAVQMLGDADGVDIPDALLKTGLPVYAFVFLHSGEDDGETVYSVMIPIIKRPEPTDEEPTPEQQSVIDQTIVALNEGVSAAEAAAALLENPEAQAETLTAGSNATASYANGVFSFGIPRGAKGDDGFSPTATVEQTSTGATITVTDAQGATTANLTNGRDGAPGVGVPSGGTTGQVLKKKSSTDYDTEWGTDEASPVQDVQINGSSVVSNGVANVPVASNNVLGVVKTKSNYGTAMDTDGSLFVLRAEEAQVKLGSQNWRPITPTNQHGAIFYGLAKAAGADMANIASTTLGVYPEAQKSAISNMLNAPESVSGSTPTIAAKAGVRYVCGECSTLTITTPASGIIDVVFESGSTPTVLTVTPPSGMAMKWANGFDPTALEANTVYEVNIMDGVYGVVGTWS